MYEGKKKSTSGSESSDTVAPDGGDLSAAEGEPSAVSEGGDSTAITEETEEGICCVTMTTCMHAHMWIHLFSSHHLLPSSPPSPSSTCMHKFHPFLLFLSLPYTHHTLTDEEKVLEEVIRDTEQLTLEEEEEEVEPVEEKGEEEKAGGGQVAEPGSPAALLDEFIARSGVYCCYGNLLLLWKCYHWRLSLWKLSL